MEYEMTSAAPPITPELDVSDPDRSIAFYRTILGFQIHFYPLTDACTPIVRSNSMQKGTCAVTDLTALDGATIAFDLDGTLVETAPDLIGAVNAILIAEGFEPLAYGEGRPFISRGARWLLQRGLEIAGAQEPAARAAALFDRFIDYYGAHIADESLPFPGVIDALKTLKAAGAKLVV